MKIIVITLNVLVFVISIIALKSCNFSEMKEFLDNADKITAVIQNNCDCEDVSREEYSIKNSTQTATFKLVGCEFDELEKEAQKVKEILSDSIPNFCEIDHFNLVFVNKGQHKVKRYSKCQEE